MYIDIEDRDPVWLKDKGDHFFRRHDFNAAVNAYCKALEADKDFLKVYLNRATTFLKMRRFENCVEDLDEIIKRVGEVKESEREADPFYSIILSRALVKKGAARAFLSQFE